MGAWEMGSFDNDDAMDWVGDFTDEPTANLIEKTLKAVTDSGDEYLEEPQGSRAIAAAEVVATLKGASHSALPKGLQECLTNSQISITPDLVAVAIEAVERVKTDSELEEIWEGAPKWLAAIDDLESRLKQ